MSFDRKESLRENVNAPSVKGSKQDHSYSSLTTSSMLLNLSTPRQNTQATPWPHTVLHQYCDAPIDHSLQFKTVTTIHLSKTFS